MMTGNWVPGDSPAITMSSSLVVRRKRWITWVLLVAILVLGAYFRTLNLYGWDEPSPRLHPDERFMLMVASDLRIPSDINEYLDSSRNHLNPRNVRDSDGNEKYSFYVYGLLPQTLTRITAVMLTPNEALPATVPYTYTSASQIANPELAFPKLTLLQQLLNPERLNLTDYYQIHKVGRAWSVLFDLGSILLVFLIGRRLYGRRVGLLAALLMSMSVLPIQLSHFFTVDAPTAFFTLLTIYCAVRIAQNGGLGSYIAVGLSIGAAMACRVTLATLGLVVLVAVATRLLKHQDDISPPNEMRLLGSLSRRRLLHLGMLILAGILTLLTFRVLQPDAFIGSQPNSTDPQNTILPILDPYLHGRGFFDIRPEPRYVENIRLIGQIISGEYDMPPSQQWANRPSFVFSLQNMILWGLGLPLGLAAWVAWAFAGWQLFRRRRLAHIIPWVWTTFYFVWQGGQFVMTMRYYSLLYGLLAIFAAWGLVQLWQRSSAASWQPITHSQQPEALQWMSNSWRKLRRWSLVVSRWSLVLVILGTLAWAYAFTRIYTHPHSRITASRWIYDHIPAGSKITSEVWDDALPLTVDGHLSNEYTDVEMAPYAEDELSKYIGSPDSSGQMKPGLLDQLDQADYIILSSNRVYGSATRIPMRYPALIRYYHVLFSGELGFKQVADINSYPNLFGVPIPDQSAEEAFSVYDHPRILIFQKTPDYSRARAKQLITSDVAWDEVYKLSTLDSKRVPTALRLTEQQWLAYRDAGTWAELFNPASISNTVPWLVWLLVLELIGFATFPLLFRLLPNLPDRGFALSKTLGLLFVAYTAWLLASLKVLPFIPTTIWAYALILVAAGGYVGWRSRSTLVPFLKSRRTALLVAEGLFLIAFFGFVIVRALNPDLWHPARGGEKPMDIAFLTAVLKSPYFPPYDPWFAGGYINYYYFGFVFVGVLVHMTGIVPTVAYNLAVPTIFALTALGAWGAAYNLLASQRSGSIGLQPPADSSTDPRSNRHSSLLLRRIERRAIVTGLVAAVFVILVGNLAQAIWFLPGSANKDDPTLPAECQRVSTYAVQQQCRGRPEWAFWDATRIVGTKLQDGTINEFPFFTFLFGDLHAHMIALPLAVLALELMVAVVRSRTQTRRSRKQHFWSYKWFEAFSALCLLSLVVGALRATNTWDFPTYLGLGILTLALVAWDRWQQGASLSSVLSGWIGRSLLLVGLSILLFLPFTNSFATDYAAFERWNGTHTPVTEFLKINGLWFFLLVSAALVLYQRARRLSTLWLAIIWAVVLLFVLTVVLLRVDILLLLLPLGLAALTLIVELSLYSQKSIEDDEWIEQLPTEGEQIPSAKFQVPGYRNLASPLIPRRLSPALPARASLCTLLSGIWALAAFGLVLLSEVAVAKGDIGRMNTVFKLGMQSWVLFALASAIAATWLWQQGTTTRDRSTDRLYNALTWSWRAGSVLLVAAALVYPITATPARLADRFDTKIGPTLDGTAYMRSGTWLENGQAFGFGEDANAIAWLQDNVSGTPIILEAQTESYRWGGRVSTYTGLPTLLGWTWHELQQRNVAHVSPVLDSRKNLIQQLYTTASPSETLQKLQLYGVEYVYVGQLERALYNPANLAKFDAMTNQGQLSLVYQTGATRIYRVPPANHLPAVLTTSIQVRAPSLPAEKNLSLDRPVAGLPQVNDYNWNPLAKSQVVAVLLWLIASYLLLALGLPIAVIVFGGWRDGGYTWARLIGLLLLGYAVWLSVSAKLWEYNLLGLALSTLVVLFLDAALLAWMGTRPTEPRDQTSAPLSLWTYASLSSIWRGLQLLYNRLVSRRRYICIVEALFLSAFAFLVVLRMYNPDLWQPIWGGEKPFEFAFLNAILRSPVMPPYDPFFAGGYINYYYYGLFLVSLPIKATGIAPAVAFNLIIPTLFALTVIGAFALVTQLTRRIRYGLIGAAFVTLLGNLAAVFQVGSSAGVTPVLQALAEGPAGFGSRLNDWFVGPSRIIPNTINEFPFWSFLFADLHPHLIALPITILAIALAYRFFTEYRVPVQGRWIARICYGMFAALVLGALAVTNSWDFPTYTLLLVGALLGAAWRRTRSRVRRTNRKLLVYNLMTSIVIGGIIAATALIMYLPFFQNYQAMVHGIGTVHDQTPLELYVLIYGLFLAVLAPVCLGTAWHVLRLRERRVGILVDPSSPVVGIVAEGWRPTRLVSVGRFILAVFGLMLFLALVQMIANLLADVPLLPPILQTVTTYIAQAPALGLRFCLIGLILVGIIVLLTRGLRAATWFVVWIAVLAWVVSLGIELIFVRDHLADGDWYRMNTVFKFGMQIWTLSALATATMLPALIRKLRRSGPVIQTVGYTSLVALTALALVFPLAGTPSRLAYRFPQTPGPTLDGLAFMDRATYTWNDGQTDHLIDLSADADAIRWLNQNIKGTPIVLQSSLEFYRAYGVRIAANTGLPTLVSSLHENEQRDGTLVAARDSDVTRFYQTNDVTEALQFLSKYLIGYIYVGPIERAAYGTEGIKKFDQMVGSYLNLAYSNEAVKIYKVNESVYSFTSAAPVSLAPSLQSKPATNQQSDLDALIRQVAADPTAANPAFALAQKYYDSGRLDDAAIVLAKAAQANPKDIALHHLWGDILRDLGRNDQAELAYEQAAEAGPTAGNYNKLGFELLKMGRLEKAENALMKAINLNPKEPEPHYHLGEVLEREGKLDQAAIQYRKYLEIAPANGSYRASATKALERLK